MRNGFGARLDRQVIYGEIKRKFVKRGVPAAEIAFINDVDTPTKKPRALKALKWELESLPERIREAVQRVAEHEQARAARDQNSSDAAFTIKLKWALGGDEWITFDQRAHAGEHLDKLRREVGMAASAEYHQISSYRGFQIFAQRRPSLSDALFPPCANRSHGLTWDPELRCTIAT